MSKVFDLPYVLAPLPPPPAQSGPASSSLEPSECLLSAGAGKQGSTSFDGYGVACPHTHIKEKAPCTPSSLIRLVSLPFAIIAMPVFRRGAAVLDTHFNVDFSLPPSSASSFSWVFRLSARIYLISPSAGPPSFHPPQRCRHTGTNEVSARLMIMYIRM